MADRVGASVRVENEQGISLGEGEVIGWQAQEGNEAIIRFDAGVQAAGNRLAGMRPSGTMVATYPESWLHPLD